MVLRARAPAMTPIANLRRLLRILRVLSAYAVGSLVASRLRVPRTLLGGRPAEKRAGTALAETLAKVARRAALPGPQRLRWLFEDLGGTYVKFGQMLALQPDILAPEYCNALFDLLDRVEPFSYAEVRRVVAEELGRPPEEIFDAFDAVPLATASVGQVHVAFLHGRKVAVKVQRPRVEVEFSSDLRLMTTAIAAI